MPDITMCSSRKCPRRKKCHRHEATPDRWQSYAGFYRRGKKCRHFVLMRKGVPEGFDILPEVEALRRFYEIVTGSKCTVHIIGGKP